MFDAKYATRIKLMKIWEILRQETDEDNPMPTSVLMKKLDEMGIHCDRRTIYADIKLLNDCGYEVLCNKSQKNEYYVVDRSFDLPELRILLDAVQAASFITEKKTAEFVDSNRYKGKRDDYENPTAEMGGVFDTLVATGEEQTFLPFWYRSFRFVRVEFEDPDFKILDFSYANYHYPLDKAGTFACSNPRYNEMWEISRNTVLCCMHEMYVDCPYYEQQQYDMDSALEMLFTMRMSGDLRMPIKSITDFAHSQMADGMLQANYPSVMVQIIPDFTLFWVLMLRDYLRYAGESGDVSARVRSFTGTVDKALESFEPYLTAEGLVGITPYWHFVDWVPGWHIGVPGGGFSEPITVTSFMYAAALKAAAEICATVGRPGLASDYRARAAVILDNVRKHCYDEEIGLYRNTPSTKEYSQHTTLWAILSGAVTGDEAGALMDRTFDGHVPVSVCSFSMNHYMFRALELSGRYNEYASKQLAGWETMLDLHCTTWCENPDSPRSECHGWSSAPTYEFSAMVLGVYPTENGYKSVRIKPFVDCFDLDWAKGTVPTDRKSVV